MSHATEAFLAQKTIALVGVSRTRGFGNTLFRHLQRQGYRVFPVNSQADTVEGQPCYRRLDDLPEPVTGVVVVVPPAQTKLIVEDCARLSIKHLWIEQGAVSDEALALCRDKGIAVVPGQCLLMYTNAGFPHSFHRWLWKLNGKY
jgi:predicted CoA-binding protein